MQVYQNLSILFYRKRKKADKQGYMPVYCRVTIDGQENEFSTGIKILYEHWNDEEKAVLPSNPEYKLFNKKLGQFKTDIERHFDLVSAKNGFATPTQVIESYKLPPVAIQQKNERKENSVVSLEIDKVISEYVKFCRRYEKQFKEGKPAPTHLELLEEEKTEILNKIEQLAKNCQKCFDDKNRLKTIVLSIDEFLMNFLELVVSGHRARRTLEKIWGRKNRFTSFLKQRYNVDDLPINGLEYKVITEFVKFNLTKFKNQENTGMKYALWFKEILDRSVSNGWVAANVFSTYQCKYIRPQIDWPTMEEIVRLIGWDFEQQPELIEIRDIYIFQSFNGLSYAEVASLCEQDIITGIDGKKWINKNRQKTDGDETLPLLPICLDILEKYKDHPVCLRRSKLLPVPTNQHYNRCLKRIRMIVGIQAKLKTHRGRYFFANEVAYNLGVPLKTIGKMLGQNSVRSVENYVSANRVNVSQNMEMVEKILFGEGGKLADLKLGERKEAKIIHLKRV